MKKLIVAIILIAVLLVSTDVSSGQPPKECQHGYTDCDIPGKHLGVHDPSLIGEAGIQGEPGAQGEPGTVGEVSVTDNSTYTEIHPTDLLNPNGYVPLAEKLLDKDMYTSKSIFKLQRIGYTCKELTRFANPGRFALILWPEWDNKYSIEVATFKKYKAKRAIAILPKATASALGLTKIGEASASAKDLNKSEHQVMAALAVRSAEAGATVIVFKGFSRPLVKVDSFVIGGGGTQVGSPQSIFNGAAGIGSSSSETVTRACVVAELYR